MEGKVGVVVIEIEKIGERVRRRMTVRRYLATFGSGEQVGRITHAATCALGEEEAKRQVLVGYGDDWIKTEANQHFPQATKILDWLRLWQVIHKAIRARRPGQDQEASNPSKAKVSGSGASRSTKC